MSEESASSLELQDLADGGAVTRIPLLRRT